MHLGLDNSEKITFNEEKSQIIMFYGGVRSCKYNIRKFIITSMNKDSLHY